MKILKTLVFLGLLLAAGMAGATALSSYTFDSKEEEQAFRDFTAELRCLVCQNQSLAESDADLADDLRREVYTMWRQGRPQEEIIDFLVSRYGDFVLYDPPLKPSTYILWFGPFLLFVAGVVVLMRTLKRKNEDREVELTEEDKQRLSELLQDANENQDSKI